jgi:hypothetical protein
MGGLSTTISPFTIGLGDNGVDFKEDPGSSLLEKENTNLMV